jgi:hypothetical protein
VYVVPAPTPTVFDTSREIEVVSLPTGRLTTGLVDPAIVAAGPGEKVATSCGMEAANHVWQVTTTVWPTGFTGTLAQPEMALLPFRNVTAPEGATAPSLEVTAAINVTA